MNTLRRLSRLPWPLAAVLPVQAWLSIRLLHANTAFVDEATYLYAGHQELNHWLHGWPVPNYPSYFSGAPVLYPPLGALADTVGGLTGARLLSLAFMLGATSVLYATAQRLYGRAAAAAAVALFVSLGSTQALGAFATYDAMAFFLLTLAAYSAVRAATAPERARWWLAAAVLLAAANSTKYATALYDPAVIALAALLTRREGMKAAVRRAGAIAAVALALIAAGLFVGGGAYYDGVTSTTLERAAGNTSAALIADRSWQWIGWLLLAAAAAPLVAWARRDRPTAAVTAVLFAAGAAAPLNQMRIHTLTSLQKHVTFGAFFAAIAAGYTVGALAEVLRGRAARIMLAASLTLGALCLTGPAGAAQSHGFFREWPDGTPLAAALAPFAHSGNDQYLAEEYDVAAYYLGAKVHADQWNDTWFFRYQGLTGIPAYQAAVRRHYFTAIVLDFGDTPAVDHAITAAMAACPDQCGYRIVAQIPYHNSAWGGHFTIWQYQGEHQ